MYTFLICYFQTKHLISNGGLSIRGCGRIYRSVRVVNECRIKGLLIVIVVGDGVLRIDRRRRRKRIRVVVVSMQIGFCLILAIWLRVTGLARLFLVFALLFIAFVLAVLGRLALGLVLGLGRCGGLWLGCFLCAAVVVGGRGRGGRRMRWTGVWRKVFGFL